MRLTCSQKELSNALNIANKAVNLNNTLPVLNNVLLRAEGKKLHFTTTNLEVAITYWIETEVKNEGEITIPSKLFTSYMNYLKDDTVDLSVEAGNTVVVKSKDSTTKIKGIDAVEFPSIPLVEKEGEAVIKVKDLKQAIGQVVFSAAFNTTRPVLSGVYFVANKDQLSMVATDSYRLSEKVIPVEKIGGDISCIIPAKTIVELGYVLDTFGEDESVTIITSKNQVFFSIGAFNLTSRLIEGQFPNYEQIIPKSTKTKIMFAVDELSLVLKRLNLFAKENNNKVVFTTGDQKVVITTDSTQYGEEEVVMENDMEGDKAEIALNSQYILDALSNIGSKKISFEISDKSNPVIIKPETENGYLHIIMPLKI